MKVKEILKVTKGKMLFGNEELEVENFSKDTRTIQKGDIYIGIKGEKFDGSNFWNQALDAGDSGCKNILCNSTGWRKAF